MSSLHGPSWSVETFLGAIGTDADRSRATRLFELHDSHPDSYYWFGQIPNGAVHLHPLGLEFSPLSLLVNEEGLLLGRGAWNRYPPVKKHAAFAELASFVGQSHESTASVFTVAAVDIYELWRIALRCAQRV